MCVCVGTKADASKRQDELESTHTSESAIEKSVSVKKTTDTYTINYGYYHIVECKFLTLN